MARNFVPRTATDQLRDSVADFRIVIVNGPRQAGKTTLLELFHEGANGTYRSLDESEQLTNALSDPVTYVRVGDRPLIIDEVQRGGDPLVLAIKRAVDKDQSPGQFVLSGSTRFLTVPTLSESLAGRAAFIDLWPFSMTERSESGGHFIERAFNQPDAFVGAQSPWSRDAYVNLLCEGSFPEVIRLSSTASRRRWFDGYVKTVIERDIAEFADVAHSRSLPRLLALAAARTGSPFVFSDAARALGISHDTASTYLAYLETVFLTAMTPAWSTNATSRITKTPKVFLTDAGLVAHLLRVTPEALREPGHPHLGALLETFVFTELLKLRGLTSDAFNIYHYRDRDSREIDLICETPDGRLVAIEVKASATPSPRDARHLRWLQGKLDSRFIAGIVLHLGEHSFRYSDRIFSLPTSVLWDHAPLPE